MPTYHATPIRLHTTVTPSYFLRDEPSSVPDAGQRKWVIFVDRHEYATSPVTVSEVGEIYLPVRES